MKFSITDFFSKFDQILRKLRSWSHLLRKLVMENYFCAVSSGIILWWEISKNWSFRYPSVIKLLEIIYLKGSSLKWEAVFCNNRYNITNALQWGVGQLSGTNYFRVLKGFLHSLLLFFGRNRFTTISRFMTLFQHKLRVLPS